MVCRNSLRTDSNFVKYLKFPRFTHSIRMQICVTSLQVRPDIGVLAPREGAPDIYVMVPDTEELSTRSAKKQNIPSEEKDKNKTFRES